MARLTIGPPDRELGWEVICVWRYGQALAKVGDDEVLQKLERRITEGKALPLAVRHWLGRLGHEVRSR